MGAGKERVDLRGGLPHGSGAGDDLGAESSPIPEVTFRQIADGSFVNTRNRAERTGDEVQLVLNNQLRREQRPAQRLSKPRLGGTIEALLVEPLHLAEQLS